MQYEGTLQKHAATLGPQPHLHHTLGLQVQRSSTPCHTREQPLCAQACRCSRGWPRVRSPRCHYLWFPVLSVRREAVRGSVERYPPQRRHTTRHSSGGRRGLGDAGRCMPPYLLCRCAAAGGAWPWGDGRVRMLRFTPLPCRPLRLRPRLYVAALHTSPLPANARRHCQAFSSLLGSSLMPKPQVRGLPVFLIVMSLSGRDRPLGDQSLVPLTALQPKLQSVRRGMSHSAHDSRTSGSLPSRHDLSVLWRPLTGAAPLKPGPRAK